MTTSAFACVGKARPERLSFDFYDGDSGLPFYFGDDEE